MRSLVRTVSLSELKAHLSHYVREVRRGGEVQILYRGVPVARLCGLEGIAGQDTNRRARLVTSGVLRPGSGNAATILDKPPLPFDADLTGAIDSDRRARL
ncbi:type II toxin-antitoxin system Phd/YefM family antitoxin [Planctomycetota bacterium]